MLKTKILNVLLLTTIASMSYCSSNQADTLSTTEPSPLYAAPTLAFVSATAMVCAPNGSTINNISRAILIVSGFWFAAASFFSPIRDLMIYCHFIPTLGIVMFDCYKKQQAVLVAAVAPIPAAVFGAGLAEATGT